MSDADDLQSRLHGLAHGAARTTAPGLADVRRRRARRQRNLALGTAAAVVAVLGAATLVLQPLADNPSVQPLGPGLTSSRPTTSDAPGTTAQDTTAPPATTTSGSASTSSDTSSAPPEEPDTVLAIDLGSLATPQELLEAGIATGSQDIGDADGQPTVPPLCTATSWQEQYSEPTDRISGGYLVSDGQLVFDLLAYPSAVAANAALVTLKDDARACPVVNEFLSVEVTAVAESIGDEFVVFALDAESGEDGSVERIWVTIARVDNVLLSATLDRDPGFAGDVSLDQQMTRDAAQANVDHLLAS